MSGHHPVYDHADAAAIVRLALDEDLGTEGDLTCRALVAPTALLEATITAKSAGVVCGLALMEATCTELVRRGLGPVEIAACASDGTRVEQGTVVWRGAGPARTLLEAERTALNLVQRLSGTATLTAKYVEAVVGTPAGIFDTRKTTPGLRLLQKHAVLMGGGRNHRLGLYDQVLIKDNHIALMAPVQPGSPPPPSPAAEAVRRARAGVGRERIIEVEIESLADLEPVVLAGADIVLLDNMAALDLSRAVLMRDALVVAGLRRAELEASGGITLATVRAVAESGVDRISTGELTHSAPVLDLSMRCRARA